MSIDFALGRDLTEKELTFKSWAESRGLRMVTERVYPRDEEDFEPYDALYLVVEEILEGKLYAQWITVSDYMVEYGTPLQWVASEEVLRLHFEDTKRREGVGMTP